MLKWRRSQVRSCRRLVSCSYTTVTLKETRGGGGCFGTGAPGEVKDGGWQGGGKNTWNEENMGVKNTSCSQQAMSDRLLHHPHHKPPALANTCNTCRGVCVSVWEQAVLYLYCLYYFVSCPCKNILQSGGIRLSLFPRGDTYCAERKWALISLRPLPTSSILWGIGTTSTNLWPCVSLRCTQWKSFHSRDNKAGESRGSAETPNEAATHEGDVMHRCYFSRLFFFWLKTEAR